MGRNTRERKHEPTDENRGDVNSPTAQQPNYEKPPLSSQAQCAQFAVKDRKRRNLDGPQRSQSAFLYSDLEMRRKGSTIRRTTRTHSHPENLAVRTLVGIQHSNNGGAEEGSGGMETE